MSAKLPLAVLAATVLAGCVPARQAAPTLAIPVPPAQWSAQSGAQPVTADWWRTFDDPIMTGMIERALLRNPDVNTAIAKVREARAQIAGVRSQALPQINAEFDAVRERTISPFGLPETYTQYVPQANVKWQVDLFGAVGDQVTAARLQYLASAAARDSSRLSVASQVAQNYAMLVGLDDRRKIIVETIAAREKGRDLAGSQHRRGYLSDLNYQQYVANLAMTRAMLPQIDLSIAQTEHSLTLLTGDPPGPVPRADSLATLHLPPLPQLGLPSELLRRRPDIAQAEEQLAASDATISSKRKAFLPQIDLMGMAGRVYQSLLPNPINIWQIGGSILQPIFHGGKLTADVDVANAQRDQSAFNYEKIVLTAFRDVENALASVDTSRRQLAADEQQAAALQRGLAMNDASYRYGEKSFLDVLTAQQSLLAARLSVIQTRTNQFDAAVTLYQALGGGWQCTADFGNTAPGVPPCPRTAVPSPIATPTRIPAATAPVEEQ